MKELEFLDIIKKTLSKTSIIGDDCAYLETLGIVITQDSLVEDIHFSCNFSTPSRLGYKAIVVNLSDIFASGAIPKYLTISLSLPENIENKFISEFYQSVEFLSKEYDFEVIGGDITGSDKIFISICAIGLTKNRKISSRRNAKVGDLVVTTGEHGSSAAGLWSLQNKNNKYPNLINEHLMPKISADFSRKIGAEINREYAMMDTSDGLIDATFKIAQASDVLISLDFEKIPYNSEIKEIASLANKDYKDWVLFGGEDYKLVACVDKENLSKLKNYHIIGEIKEKNESHFVEVKFDEQIRKIRNLDKTYNHFKKEQK